MTPDRDRAGTEGEPLPKAPGQAEPQTGPRTTLSGREWLGRARELPVPPMPVLHPQPPSRRFIWGVRTGIVLAMLFYGGLVVWSRFAGVHAMSSVATALVGLAAVFAVVALVEAWRWAGRSRLNPSQLEEITANLSPAQKKTVRRMANGRGDDVAELRPRAAATARAGQQSTGLVTAVAALNNLAVLLQLGGPPVSLIIGAALLPVTGAILSYTLWLGHRARTLNAALYPDAAFPAVLP